MLRNLLDRDTPCSADHTPFTLERLQEVTKQIRADQIAHPELFLNYPSYLRTPLWQRTRRRILKRDRRTCVRCGEKAKEVHHLAYTNAVMKGEDDSQLVSLCADCHDKVEFDENRNCRTDVEKARVLEDREGAQRERKAAQEALRIKNEVEQKLRDSAGGRCFWCKGNTEYPMTGRGGLIYVIPTVHGDDVPVWMCKVCSSVLDLDKRKLPRIYEEKLHLLRKRATARYTRPKPSPGFTFTKAFWRLNAMQQEGIMNEFHWNLEKYRKVPADPRKFKSNARYEETKGNGRERRT